MNVAAGGGSSSLFKLAVVPAPGASPNPCHLAGVANGSSETIKNHASFIWSVADLLRGDEKQSEYGKVVLPMTVLRRFDGVLAPVKQDMLDTYERLRGRVENYGPVFDAHERRRGLEHELVRSPEAARRSGQHRRQAVHRHRALART